MNEKETRKKPQKDTGKQPKKEPKEKKLPDPEAVAVGARIRLTRKSKGLTYEQLADLADTSVQFLSKVERGEQCMTTGRFIKLVKALGVTSDYLLFGRDEAVGRAAIAAECMAQWNVVDRDLAAQMLLHMENVLNEMRPEHQ